MFILIFLKKKIKILPLLCIFLFILNLQINPEIVNSLTMENYQTNFITEELRLKVPSDFKEAWLKAEKEVWEPWLSNKDGFLGRQIFWNKEKGEALILVNWKSKKLWKSISMNEVNEVQGKFEDNVKKSLDTDSNPFEFIYEGELYQEG